MSYLDDIFEDRKYTEETMVKDISTIVEEINSLGEKTKTNFNHLLFQLVGLTICIIFGIYSTATIFFSIASFISLILSGVSYSKRKESVEIYRWLVWEYQKREILTKKNKRLIEKFRIKEFWFTG